MSIGRGRMGSSRVNSKPSDNTSDMSVRKRIVYILAASHSGSTLLAMMLGSHPEICTVGELKLTSLENVERYRCSCLEFIRNCPFWEGIRMDMEKMGYPFDITNPGTNFREGATPYVRTLLDPLHRGPVLELVRNATLKLSPSWRKRLPMIQSRNAALVSCICKQAGKNVVVDSSKVGIRLKFLLRNKSFDVKVIRLIRDGRGVSLTYTDPAQFADAIDPALRGGGTGGGRDSERLDLAQAATEWLRSNEEAEAILRGLERSRWTEVRYESLCDGTEETLRNLFAFIGVDPVQFAGGVRSADQHVVGNGMRLDADVDIRLDDRWRNILTRRDLETFDSIAGKMNRRLGYE